MTNLTFEYLSESQQLIVDLTATDFNINSLTPEQESMIDEATLNYIRENLLHPTEDVEIEIIYSKKI
jgi:hypothetical protein